MLFEASFGALVGHFEGLSKACLGWSQGVGFGGLLGGPGGRLWRPFGGPLLVR